ncbi:F-box/kelch-repeat protein [Canna indica]|uniref:F-box/kelch-repeat protein n=1 Tax=Canna indica TaxID=4628 RepID=A0AAQ3KF38_9LILI|nr:F-box/kelch-repeat protein [Canna indica]
MESHGEEKEEAEARGLHGDILDAVVSRISALDLLAASSVSREWHTAVLSTRFSTRRRPPCLILRLQSRRGASTLAFEPVSRRWFTVPIPLGSTFHGLDDPPVSALASSHAGGARLYALSGSKLALAADPFGASWSELVPPRYWRTDPVVALVGHRIVVAGRTNELEDEDARSVEVWDGCRWEPCEPMPEALMWSPAVSAAASQRRLYMLEKREPFTASWFDPEAKRWGPTTRVRLPDPSACHAAIGFLNGRLVLAVAGGSAAGLVWRPESVTLWAVDEETLEVAEEVGRMPREMVLRLVEDGWGLEPIGVLSEGGFAYVYNPSYMKEFFLCEVQKGGGCRWETIAPPPGVEERPMHRVVFGCCELGMDDRKMATN